MKPSSVPCQILMDLFTSKIYNNSYCNWEKFQRHLQYTWHNSNTYLNVLNLYTEIIMLKNTALLSFDASDIAGKIIYG